jgi:8-amino-7-oxononanoate synthase
MGPLDFLELELSRLDEAGLRRRPEGPSLGLRDFCTNDYLGYGRAPVSRATLLACEGTPLGAGASRLIHGTAPPHAALEEELADWTGLPGALLFASGYAANVGLLAALVLPSDTVVSDALNHASIIDGCRLTRATVRVVPHRDLDAFSRALENAPGRRWVVTESYFSMDGDQADLPGLRRLCDRFGAALLVDEAHALGVFGPQGAGLCRERGVVPDALVGTLGKALGSHGAFVAGSAQLRDWLWNRARSLVFSTGTSPLLAQLTLENVRRAREDDGARARIRGHATRLVSRLRAAGVAVSDDLVGPIVPLVVGDNDRALALASAARDAGFQVQAIRPPTVPRGTARLRVTLSAVASSEDVERLAQCLITQLTAWSSSAPEPVLARPT